MANANNLTKARQRILDIIKDSGDDGIHLSMVQDKSYMRLHGVLSHLGALIKQGTIRRHPQFNHYFYVGEPVQKSPEKKTEHFLTPEEEALFDKFLARMGLQRIK